MWLEKCGLLESVDDKLKAGLVYKNVLPKIFIHQMMFSPSLDDGKSIVKHKHATLGDPSTHMDWVRRALINTLVKTFTAQVGKLAETTAIRWAVYKFGANKEMIRRKSLLGESHKKPCF